jgi:hypothetical protein
MEVIMKRFLLFYAAFALMTGLGCEKAKSPTSPENLNLAKNQAALKDSLTTASPGIFWMMASRSTAQLRCPAEPMCWSQILHSISQYRCQQHGDQE